MKNPFRHASVVSPRSRFISSRVSTDSRPSMRGSGCLMSHRIARVPTLIGSLVRFQLASMASVWLRTDESNTSPAHRPRYRGRCARCSGFGFCISVVDFRCAECRSIVADVWTFAVTTVAHNERRKREFGGDLHSATRAGSGAAEPLPWIADVNDVNERPLIPRTSALPTGVSMMMTWGSSPASAGWRSCHSTRNAHLRGSQHHAAAA